MNQAAVTEDMRFRNAVSNSWEAVWCVAQHIHSCGNCSIKIQPLRLRPSFEQRAGYGDMADLLVCKAGSNRWLPVEVKWRNILFSDASDFPHNTIFVDRSAKTDAAMPVCYFMVNRDLTHAARIEWKTHEQWLGPNTYHDARKGYEVTVYECPLNLVRFFALKPGELLRRRAA